MENIGRQILLMTLFVSCLLASAQSKQSGYVKEYNDKLTKTALAGVELQVSGAGTAVSAKDGAFTLQFSRLKVGDRVSLNRAIKDGYEIFNKEAVEQWNISGDGKPFTVVMCRSDKFRALCDMYSRVSHESYKRQHALDEARLEKELKAGRLKEAEYKQQLYDLRQSYAKQLENIDSYVEKFARIDLSELSQTEQAIIDKVQVGDMEGAIAEYEKHDFAKKYAQETADIQQIKSAKAELAKIEEQKTAERDSLFAMITRQVELYTLAGGQENLLKAKKLLVGVADADTTYWEAQHFAGWFIDLYNADYTLSMSLFHRALAAAMLAKTKNDPNIALSYNNIGTVFQNQGDYLHAMEYHQKALKIYLDLYGEAHPDVATGYNNIGYIFAEQGEYDQAIGYCQKALNIRITVYGVNHSDVSNSYNNICNVLAKQGKYAPAMEYYQKALKIRLAVYGENHPDVARIYNNIGAVLDYQGEYDQAMEYHQKALKILLAVFGEQHPDVALSYDNIGVMLVNQGEYAQAMEYHQKALKIRLAVYGENHPSIAYSYNNIGVVLSNQGGHAQAIEYLQKALKIWLAIYGENHPDVSISYNNIGFMLYKLEEYAQAMEYYQKALKIRLAVYGENHPDVALSYNNIGVMLLDQSEYAQAIEYLQKALKIRLVIYGENHPAVATSYNNIGNTLNNQGEYAQAMDYLQKAIEIYKDHDNQESLGFCYNTLFDCAQKLQETDPERAKAAMKLYDEWKKNGNK